MKREVRVLIADDDENTCQLLNEYVTTLGGYADVAYDGKRALELLDAKKYDFVFLDCNMPELTGLELTEYLKGKKPKPKIIMITGYGPIDEDFAKTVGVDTYLTKPVLLDKVKKILKKI